MNARRTDRRVVYSTDPEPEPPVDPPAPSPPAAQQNVRITLDRKGRRGKVVTVISGLQLSAAELAALGQQLRRRCGAGGTVRDGRIEIQGDHRERIARWLSEQGYRVRAG